MVNIKEYSILSIKDSFMDITQNIEDLLEESGIENGCVVVETIESTVGLMKIGAENKEVLADVLKEIRRIVPARINFINQDAPENTAGHIKSSLFGSSLSLIVTEGKLICQGKQNIYLLDHDGPQNRKFTICVIGE